MKKFEPTGKDIENLRHYLEKNGLSSRASVCKHFGWTRSELEKVMATCWRFYENDKNCIGWNTFEKR